MEVLAMQGNYYEEPSKQQVTLWGAGKECVLTFGR
jgi:hypothetical protein